MLAPVFRPCVNLRNLFSPFSPNLRAGTEKEKRETTLGRNLLTDDRRDRSVGLSPAIVVSLFLLFLAVARLDHEGTLVKLKPKAISGL